MKTVTLHDKKFGLCISSAEIQAAVDRVAQAIIEDMKDSCPLFLVVLNGAFMFAGDLFKRINFDCEVTFMKLASYEGTESTGKVKKLIGLSESIEGRDVIIIEDIVDSGITMENMLIELFALRPASIRIASCLFKPAAFTKQFKIDYVGFSIPNDFIVGYGLDYDGLGRNLPDIYKIN
jgi:hypoxanthine phosphoribosyltransferase